MSDREAFYAGRKDSHDFGEALRAIYKDLDRLYGDVGKVYAAVNESGGGVGGGITGPQVQNWEEDRRFRAWLGSHDIADGYEPGTVVDTADWEQAAERTDAMYNRDGDASHAWWYTPAPGDLSGFVYSSPDAGNRRKRIPAVAVGPRGQEHELPVQLDGSFNHTITGNVSGMWDWIIRILEVIGATEYAIPGRADNAFIFNFNAIRNAAPGTIPSVVHARSIYSRLEALEAGGGGGGGGTDLTALTNRVTGVEGSVTTLSNDITALQGAVGNDWTNDRTLQALLNDWDRVGSVRHSVSSIDNRLGTLEVLVGHTSRPMDVTDNLWDYSVATRTSADSSATTLTEIETKVDYLYDDAVGANWASTHDRTISDLLRDWTSGSTVKGVVDDISARVGPRATGRTGGVWNLADQTATIVGSHPQGVPTTTTLWNYAHEAHVRGSAGQTFQLQYQNTLNNAFGSTLYTGGTIASRLSDLESDVMDLSSGDDAGAVLTALNNHINNDFNPLKSRVDTIITDHGAQWDTIGPRPTNRNAWELWTAVDRIMDNMLEGTNNWVDVNALEDRVNAALGPTLYTGTRTFGNLFTDWTSTQSVQAALTSLRNTLEQADSNLQSNLTSHIGTFTTHQQQVTPRLTELGQRPTSGDLADHTAWHWISEFHGDIDTINTDVLGNRNISHFPVTDDNDSKIWGILSTHRINLAAVKTTADNASLRVFGRLASPGLPAVEGLTTQYNALNGLLSNTVLEPTLQADLVGGVDMGRNLLYRTNALTTKVEGLEGHFNDDGRVDVISKMLGLPDMIPDTLTADGVADWWDRYGSPDRRNFAYLSDFETLLQFLRGWQWEDTVGYSDASTFTYEVARDSDGNIMVDEQGDPVYDLTRRVGWQQILLSLLRAVNPGIGTPEEDLHKIPSVPELSLAAGLDTAALDELKRQLFGERDQLSIAGAESTLVTALEEFLAQIRANTSEIGVNRSNLNRVRDQQIGSPSDPAAAAVYSGLIDGRTPTLWEMIERLFRISAGQVERLSFGNEYDEDGNEIPKWFGTKSVHRGDPSDPATFIDNLQLPKVVSGDGPNVEYRINDEIGSRLVHNRYDNTLSGFLIEERNYISRAVILML